MIIKIAKDYTETPGGRYMDDGPFSGEHFRDAVLEKKYLESIQLKEKLIIDFDGGYGYSTGFLEETFGGMIRKGYALSELLNHMNFISNEEPEIIMQVITYMKEEEQRQMKLKTMRQK